MQLPNLIKEFGLDTLDQKQQEEALIRIGNLIFQATLVHALGEMSEKTKTEFDAMLGEKSDDEKAIIAFLQEKVPNLDNIMRAEIEKLRADAASFMQQVDEKT